MALHSILSSTEYVAKSMLGLQMPSYFAGALHNVPAEVQPCEYAIKSSRPFTNNRIFERQQGAWGQVAKDLVQAAKHGHDTPHLHEMFSFACGRCRIAILTLLDVTQLQIEV